MPSTPESEIDVPVFEGHPPWLALPAVIIFALLCAIEKPRGSGAGGKVGSWLFLFPQVVHVGLAIFTYFHRNGPPLTQNLLASAAENSGALFICSAIIYAAVATMHSQWCMRITSFQAMNVQNKRIETALVVLMLLPIVWGFGSLFAFSAGFWPDRLAIDEVEWLMLAQIAMVLHDLLLTVVLHRLRGQISGAKQVLAANLSVIVSYTLAISFLLLNLKAIGNVLHILPRQGWVSYTVGIGGYLSAAELHLVAWFLMCRAVERHGRASTGEVALEEDASELEDTTSPKDV
ncbi:hypothetical protein PsYK624_078830 [Phanerochaete sordida]|uniref:Uncharacterized protein n=1 Tax=Phanerochaete sordida TaxID=48140 RepID=A0A9P3G9I4_9APHY|nr:hypothetical protein PsYK624_078830 [Phanerochaete sordida]